MRRAMLGDIEISVVESDEISIAADTTDKPVEVGQDVSNHVKPKPDTIDIRGIIVGPDAPQKWSKLKLWNKTGELLRYINRVVYNNVVIQSLNSVHDGSIANGYKFDMTLKHIRIARPRVVSLTSAPPSVKTKTRGKSKAGTKQPKKR